MRTHAGRMLSAFLCVVMGGVACLGAGEWGVSPDDFGIDPAAPVPLPPPFAYQSGAVAPVNQVYVAPPAGYVPAYPESSATPYQAAIAPVPPMQPAAPFAAAVPYPPVPYPPAPAPAPLAGAAEPTGIFLPNDPLAAARPVPVLAAPVVPVPAPGPSPVPVGLPAAGVDPLQAAAPELYASIASSFAAAGDATVPVVVRPATTSQATDLSGVPVDLSVVAAQNNPVVDWSAARAGTPYPVFPQGPGGPAAYVVPIQVPVYVQPGEAAAWTPGIAMQSPVPGTVPVPAPMAPPPALLTGAPLQPGLPGDPFAGVIAVTPGRQAVVPVATAAIAGNGGVFYYGANPVSIASAIGVNAADGTEYFDFSATPSGAINLITAAQVKQALQRRVPLVILDVRGDLVREIEGHIQGDVGVPLEPVQTFAARVARAIPTREAPVVVYCEDGIWSSQAADILLSMGYKTFLMGAYRLWF